MQLDNITLQPKKPKKGQEPLELLLVFNAHPSQLSLELSKIPPQPLPKSDSTDTNQQQEKPMIVSYS